MTQIDKFTFTIIAVIIGYLLSIIIEKFIKRSDIKNEKKRNKSN